MIADIMWLAVIVMYGYIFKSYWDLRDMQREQEEKYSWIGEDDEEITQTLDLDLKGHLDEKD